MFFAKFLISFLPGMINFMKLNLFSFVTLFPNLKVDFSIVTPHLPNILAFLEILSKDQNVTDTLISASCGLIG